MGDTVKVANAQGFWGDIIDAPVRVAEQVPDLDYLTMDYLAEVSLSIMAIQRDKDPKLGYARDFVQVIRSLCPLWKSGRSFRVVSNAGGLNPRACAEACLQVLQEEGCEKLKVALVTGDDVLDELTEHPDEGCFRNMDSGEALSAVSTELVTANAYLGADPIAEALDSGADIVITGRVADPSMVVGACRHHFGWSADDYHALAGATVAGHLIECGTQVTGGIWTHWMELEDPVDLGFPIVEISSDGSCVVTKPDKTGGEVNVQTVKEQLLYEISDPGHYLSPDITLSFLDLEVEEESSNRVRVSGASGMPPTSSFKVSATYREGFRAEGMLTIVGHRAVAKARRCGEVIIERVKRAGYELDRSQVECLGAGDSVPGLLSPEEQEVLKEVVLRVAVADSRKEAVERFAKELAPLVTGGAPGVTGYTSGRPRPRPVFGFWPCLIPRERVNPKVEVLTPCLN